MILPKKPLRLENRHILLTLSKTLTLKITLKDTGEVFTARLPATSWAQIADRHGEWQKQGTPLEQLKKFPLLPSFITKVSKTDSAILICFSFAGIEMTAGISLSENGFDCTVFPSLHSRQSVVSAVFPGHLAYRDENAYKIAFSSKGQGTLFIPGKEPWEYHCEAVGQMMPMRWFAGLAPETSYVCIAENSEDAFYDISYKPGKEFSTSFRWMPSMGTLRYKRKILYHFFKGDSHTEAAGIFRKFVQAKGLIVPLQEKIKMNPSLDKLWGGVLIMLGYYNDPKADYLSCIKNIRKMGIDRGLVYPVSLDGVIDKTMDGERFIKIPLQEVKAIQKMGFLTATFFCPTNIQSTSPHSEALSAMTTPAGIKKPSWRINKTVWFRPHLGKALQAFDLLYDFSQFDLVHFDVLPLSAGKFEDYSPEWPMTRHEHLAQSTAMLEYFIEQGKLVSGEGKSDSLARFLSWGSFRVNIIPQYSREAKLPTHIKPVPLWHLVFHDVMFHSSWEHHTYNDGNTLGTGIPRVGYLHDMLYGDMPSVFPIGRIYRYPGQQAEYYSIDPLSAKVKTALNMAKKSASFHKLVGTCRMISHRFLDKDFLVQETIFDNGIRSVVNFSDKKFIFENKCIPKLGNLVIK